MTAKCIGASQVTENLRGRKVKNPRFTTTDVLQETTLNNPSSPGTPSDSHFKHNLTASTPASLHEKGQRNQPKPQVSIMFLIG